MVPYESGDSVRPQDSLVAFFRSLVSPPGLVALTALVLLAGLMWGVVALMRRWEKPAARKGGGRR